MVQINGDKTSYFSDVILPSLDGRKPNIESVCGPMGIIIALAEHKTSFLKDADAIYSGAGTPSSMTLADHLNVDVLRDLFRILVMIFCSFQMIRSLENDTGKVCASRNQQNVRTKLFLCNRNCWNIKTGYSPQRQFMFNARQLESYCLIQRPLRRHIQNNNMVNLSKSFYSTSDNEFYLGSRGIGLYSHIVIMLNTDEYYSTWMDFGNFADIYFEEDICTLTTSQDAVVKWAWFEST